jgi:Outer membrane protein beta-barrel domain
MKKVILLLLAITVMINNSHAQERTILFGFKAGTNYSDAYDQKGVTFNTVGKFGIVAGAYFAACVGDHVCVQPELLFSQKGFKATGKVLGNAFDVTRTTNYLDIPLMVALKPNEFIRVVFGPQYSYLLKQKDVFDNNALTSEQQNQFNNENIRKNMFSIIGGVDISLQKFVIGARLGWDMRNNNLDAVSVTPQYKNAWAQATLGFKIL